MPQTKWERFPITEIIHPRKENSYWLYKDHYFAVDEFDNVLKYPGASFQCNTNRKFMEKLLTHKNHPGIRVVHIPRAFIPFDVQEYME